MDRKTFAGTGILTAFLLALSACTHNNAQPAGFPLHASGSDLHFSTLSTTWDEAMPLGNAVVGALIWQKGDRARFSLDRIDLWDQRPVTAFQEETFSYAWLTERLRTGDYGPVAGQFENPEGQGPAPSKIPGAALEFHSEGWGAVTDTRLYLHEAACSVTWENGVRLLTFAQADAPVGWFIFEQVPDSFQVDLLPPAYRTDPGSGKAVSSLQQLGYEQGEVTTQEDGGRHRAVYHQRGYGDFHYDVAVEWRRKGARVTGAWSVTSSPSGQDAGSEVEKALRDGPKKAYRRHLAYWTPFWERSTVTVPDTLIQHQYDRELYKFGSATRSDSYPISLQSVWTADDGQLPPWKGDYHHDLNTQLSYWPAYKGNHLEEGLGYLNTLWNQRDNFKSFTKRFFGKDGLAAPGYSTLDGYPMPGWVQYGFSQTTAAWLAQHFYLHWKYSADTAFLRERAYPFLKDVAVFLEQMSVRNEEGFRTLAYSASPEFNDNRMDAWFTQITNFDLALMRFTFTAAAQMAEALDLDGEAGHWSELAGELPPFALDEEGGLSVAPGIPYAYSHRHFSHAMAIHPLGLLDISHGAQEKAVIEETLSRLHALGPDWWCGYSYSWLANLEARAAHGEAACEALRTFASCFCLRNSFHANGDQSHSGKSRLTYRPFTLEGNFAFASGLQEMLLQSHTGIIEVFPAIPSSWRDIRFERLRAEGAFLVSAQMEGGETVSLTVTSEKGGRLRIRSPRDGQVVERETAPGETVRIL